MGKWFKTNDLVILEINEQVATITLNRPEKRNALSDELLYQLRMALLEADDLKGVSVVVLQGQGKDFCAGYDLTAAYAGNQTGTTEFDPLLYRKRPHFDDDCWLLERSQELTTILFDMHKLVIAKIHGNCLAGGTDIALMCDMVIAADDARIGFPATRANGSPPNNMWFYHVGPQWAKRLLATGDSLTGKDAAKIGLILDSYTPETLDNEVRALAKRLTYVDTDLLTSQKRIVNLAMELQGARTMLRLSAEMDARAHLADGPRRTAFRADIAKFGLKTALKNRDQPFGDGMVRLSRSRD